MDQKKRQIQLLLAVCLLAVNVLLPTHALAVPDLQIWIPGAHYDMDTETWVIDSLSYDLWVIGAKEIEDVKIALAVSSEEDGGIGLTWIDPGHSDYAQAPASNVTTIDMTEANAMAYDDYRASYSEQRPDPGSYGFEPNSTPIRGDGKLVPSHGVFPTDFYEYYIGDFGTSETVYNFNPPAGYTGDDYVIDESEFSSLDSARGEIKKFHLDISGYTWVDIVAYDHYYQSNGKVHSVFSPFSHDGGGGTPVPEPATFLLLGCGCLALGRILKKGGERS